MTSTRFWLSVEGDIQFIQVWVETDLFTVFPQEFRKKVLYTRVKIKYNNRVTEQGCKK